MDKDFLKKIIYLSIPVIIQQLLNNLLNLTDTMMIGFISEQAISAVAIANKIFFIYQLILFGLSNGVGIFISQLIGANDYLNAKKAFNFGERICLLVGVLFSCICFVLSDFILALFVNDFYIISLSKDYFVILIISFIPFAIMNMYSVGFRSMGKPKYAMVSSLLSVIVNIILNTILIFGLFGFPRLGLKGAAIATVISRYIECGVLSIFGNKYTTFMRQIKKLEMEYSNMLTIILKSFPLMINELIWSIGLNVIFVNYCFISENYIPAITVADTISNLVYVAFSGCSVAVSVIVGKDLGNNNLDKAFKDSQKLIKFAISVYVIGGIIIILTRNFMPYLFHFKNDNSDMLVKLLIVKALFSWTQGYSNTIYYILRSGGDTKSVLYIDGIFTWIGPVMISTLVSRILNLDLLSCYIMVEGLGLVKILIATYFYNKMNWLRSLVQ